MKKVNSEMASIRKSIDNHIMALCKINHSEEDIVIRIKDINWCIDQLILLKLKEVK